MSKPPRDPPHAPLSNDMEKEQSSITRELSRVEEATVAFYEAFAGRTIEKMERLWSHSPYARCVHPGWEPVVGWVEIRQSWVDIFRTMEAISFTLEDLHIEVVEKSAWVNLTARAEVSTEEGETFQTSVIATNILEMVEGTWRMTLHHSSHVVDDDELEEEMDDDDLGSGPPQGGFKPN